MTIKKKSSKTRIEIDLTGPQGNAFCLLGCAKQFGGQLGWDKKRTDKLLNEMRSGDYEHLVKVFDREFGSFCTLYR